MMRALVRRAGHRIITVEKTDERCTLDGERHGTGETDASPGRSKMPSGQGY